ncbi:MAG: hypothetical protein M1830_004720 [Pleopsidium flavum]|nr:MAG: hypothetical protein M1830_004720 [Pleopsidium flavum]
MNGSTTTTTSATLTEESLPSSRLLSSSITSLTSSRNGAPHLSKTYRQASTLFLTRRLSEALAIIEPVITVDPHSEPANGDSETPELALVASASRSTRIKIWNLYLTILNAIIELGPEEGKNAIGSKEWRSLVSKVRDGAVWEDVVRHGYGGVEGDVDADVVINLATLLLAQSPSQTLNQQRLESYLSASSHPNLDISSRLLPSDSSEIIPRRPSTNGHGTDTPRDLHSRIKILELYTLHVLPRNGEWEYARDFIGMSEILDEERREVFLQTLQGLWEEKNRDGEREAQIQRERDEELAKHRIEAERRRAEEAQEEEDNSQKQKEGKLHKRASSEVDYGIESSNPNDSPRTRPTKDSSKSTKSTQSSRAQFPPTPHSPRPAKRSTGSSSIYNRARHIMAALQRLVQSVAQSVSANPMVLLRTVLFLMGLILAFSRRDVRDRIRRITGAGWDKMRGTVGMGVKVSYI